MTVCLDSWAVLAWLDGDEPAYSWVEGAIGDRPLISWVNLVEVYYRVERDHGRAEAYGTLAELRAATTPDLPGTARMIEAARYKAEVPIALGDCFAIITAAHHGATLWTGDPEILDQERLPCNVVDLRPGGSEHNYG